MKRFYWVMIPASLAAIGWLWWGRGKAAAIVGAALWAAGWIVYKQRRYVENGIGIARTSLVEKARAWMRG